MRPNVAVMLFALLCVSFCGCPPPWIGDYKYDLCTYIEGATADSLTGNPVEGVHIKIYHYKTVIYEDSTTSAGVYRSGKIERLFWSTPKELRELESKPPLRRYLDLRMVFEKERYRKSELAIPVEFVYCSSHPNPVEIPVVRIPDVLLVPVR